MLTKEALEKYNEDIDEGCYKVAICGDSYNQSYALLRCNIGEYIEGFLWWINEEGIEIEWNLED